MSYGRSFDKKMDMLHEEALRRSYNDYNCKFGFEATAVSRLCKSLALFPCEIQMIKLSGKLSIFKNISDKVRSAC